ncbi:MAG: NAD(P)-dependent oxidoreductase [Alphaproteobacteria bacterium]
MTRIFLTHDPHACENYYGAAALAALGQLGDLRLNPDTQPLSSARLIAAAQDAEIIVSFRTTPGEAALFENAPDLVAFLRCAVDIRNVDVDAASANGILVTNASPGFVDAVVELLLGMIIDLARGITRATMVYRQEKVPKATMGRQLAGSTLGILGYGNIGRGLANVAKALGMTILVNDPYVQPTDPAIRQVDMPTLMEQSDFVVCLVVANAKTENLLDAAAFARMKTSAYFINGSRGNLVDDAALHDVLVNGRIAGAALDVGRAADQMPSPQLAKLSNVIATPHIGGLTRQAAEAQALETVEQVRALVSGNLPHNAINPASASRLSRLGIKAE